MDGYFQKLEKTQMVTLTIIFFILQVECGTIVTFFHHMDKWLIMYVTGNFSTYGPGGEDAFPEQQ